MVIVLAAGVVEDVRIIAVGVAKIERQLDAGYRPADQTRDEREGWRARQIAALDERIVIAVDLCLQQTGAAGKIEVRQRAEPGFDFRAIGGRLLRVADDGGGCRGLLRDVERQLPRAAEHTS